MRRNTSRDTTKRAAKDVLLNLKAENCKSKTEAEKAEFRFAGKCNARAHTDHDSRGKWLRKNSEEAGVCFDWTEKENVFSKRSSGSTAKLARSWCNKYNLLRASERRSLPSSAPLKENCVATTEEEKFVKDQRKIFRPDFGS